MKKIVGLTGGIASGKSAAAAYFGEFGAYIINTDVVSRAVADGNEAKNELRQRFPKAFDGDVLNRRALREIVFADSGKLSALNGIMHPLIYRETEREAREADADIVVVEAPLLFEAGFDRLTAPIITVSCDEKIRINRLMKRDAISETLAKQMVSAQLSDTEREARADVIIYGNGTLAELRAQVLRVYLDLEG